jgi:hypothetical protein
VSDDPGRHLSSHRAPADVVNRAFARRAALRSANRTGPAIGIVAAILFGFVIGRYPGAEPSPSTTSDQVPVRLVLQDRDARSVAVAGSWNAWRAEPMAPLGDGTFVLTRDLPRGHQEYMFVVDGTRWVTDPAAPLVRDDGFGNRNGVLEL